MVAGERGTEQLLFGVDQLLLPHVLRVVHPPDILILQVLLKVVVGLFIGDDLAVRLDEASH